MNQGLDSVVAAYEHKTFSTGRGSHVCSFPSRCRNWHWNISSVSSCSKSQRCLQMGLHFLFICLFFLKSWVHQGSAVKRVRWSSSSAPPAPTPAVASGRGGSVQACICPCTTAPWCCQMERVRKTPLAPCPPSLEMFGLFLSTAAPGALGFWQRFGLVGRFAFLRTPSNPSVCLGTFQGGTLKRLRN